MFRKSRNNEHILHTHVITHVMQRFTAKYNFCSQTSSISLCSRVFWYFPVFQECSGISLCSKSSGISLCSRSVLVCPYVSRVFWYSLCSKSVLAFPCVPRNFGVSPCSKKFRRFPVFQECSSTSLCSKSVLVLPCSKSVLVLPCVPTVFWYFHVFQESSGTSLCSNSVLVLPCVPTVFWYFPVFQGCSGTSLCSNSVLVLPCVPRVFWHFPVFQECCHFTVSLTHEGEETFFVNTGNVFVLFPAFMQSITAYEDGSKFADCLTVRGTYVAQLVSSADNLITTIHFVEAYTVHRKNSHRRRGGVEINVRYRPIEVVTYAVECMIL